MSATKGTKGIEILPVEGVSEISPGDDLPQTLLVAAGDSLSSGDVLIVTHKVVSKSEGRIVKLSSVEPSEFALEFASRHDKDPRHVEVVLRESRRIVKMERGIIISETPHGFVCANAGVDASNVPGNDTVCLLPVEPDASAARIHERIHDETSLHVPVVVTDSFGRPWRNGITNVAVGLAGMEPLTDYRGQSDPHGYPLEASVLAVADELAAASELVMNKTDAVPAAIVRNYPYQLAPGAARNLVMDPERDLFR